MATWSIIALVAATFAVAGTAFDKFLLLRQKHVLHEKLVSYWLSLEEVEYHNLARSLASKILSAFNHALSRPFFSWKSLLLWTFVSYLLTSIASLISWLIQGGFEQTNIPLPFFPTYISNWIFDLLTISVTLKVLYIVKKSHPSVGVIAVVGDIIIAVILVVLCRSTSLWLNSIGINHSLLGAGQEVVYLHEYVKAGLAPHLNELGYTSNANITAKYSTTFIEYIQFSVNELLKPLGEYEEKIYITIEEGVYSTSFVTRIESIGDWLWILVPATVFIPTIIVLLLFNFPFIVKNIPRYVSCN